MTTHRSVLEELERAAGSGEPVVLATVVGLAGSSYGGVGTRMVIRVDGTSVGLVSGGCLESDLCQHALDVHSTGRPRVISYDTRADDDAVWGLGLGCNGLIDVLLDPLPAVRSREVAALLSRALAGDAPTVIATVISAPAGSDGRPAVGAQALLDRSEPSTSGDWGNLEELNEATRCLPDALATGRTGLVRESGNVLIAFEVVMPVIRLIICGSGPDAAPVARFASQLGWDVTVVDHRPVTAARAARLGVSRVVECHEPARLGDAVELGPRTAAVVMSHHFARDTDYLQALLSAHVAYAGVLGPGARTDRMLAELATRAEGPTNAAEALFAPVGLDVGGEGPDAIALAIVSEVSAVMHERTAAHLRARSGALHSLPASANTRP